MQLAPPTSREPSQNSSARDVADRRQRPTPILSSYTWLSGRRRGARRTKEGGAQFVDTYGTGLFLVVTAIATLNILDAFFTILFLSHGGRELNPVVQMSLDSGVWWFIGLKSLGIGVCLGFLTLTKNFTSSRFGLLIVLLGYVLLLGWHTYLYVRLPEITA